MADAKTLFVLLESSAGYALFEVISLEEIGVLLEDAAAAVVDMDRFGRSVKLKAFYPFESAQDALDNANALSEHAMCDTLHNFLEMNVPSSSSTDKKKKGSKTAAFSVGVVDPGLATAIADGLGISCRSDDTVREVLRGCRLHLERFVKGLGGGVGGAATTADAASAGSAGSSSSGGGSVAVRAQLGLGHAYSRSKVKFNPARSDNMIIQSIAILDQLDKDINTFAMRVREWYSWHFPELKELVPDNVMYARCAALIRNKSRLVASSSSSPRDSEGDKKKDGDNDEDDDEEEEEKKHGDDDEDDSSPSSLVRDLASQVLGGDAEWAQRIRAAAKMSIGMDCADADMVNICNFTDRMVQLAAYRQRMVSYLNAKMNIVAPNLSAILGDSVAARLISKAGSLTNLAKAPASTVQILGAEKALFRALKTKGNTPKYGLIYHSTFIGRAAAKNKGRISRYLANKCSIATRIDSFSDYAATGNAPNSLYGEKLRDQVEERLQFYETGKAPRRNLDVMEEVSRQLKRAAAGATGGGSNDNTDDAMDVDDDAEEDTTKKKPSAKHKKKEKKKMAKKDKKRKRSEAGLEEEDGDDNDNDNDENQSKNDGDDDEDNKAEEKKEPAVAAADENKAAKKKAAKKAKKEAAAAAAEKEEEEEVAERKKTEQEPVVDEKAAKKSAKKTRKEAAAAAAAEKEEEDEEVAERKKTAQQEPAADDEKAAKKASKKAKKEAAAAEAAAEIGEEEGGAAGAEADETKKKKKDKKKKKSKN